jgi:hypothetical protein
MKKFEWSRGCGLCRDLVSTGRIPISARDHHIVSLTSYRRGPCSHQRPNAIANTSPAIAKR